MFFIAPRQVIQWDESVVFEQKGFSIIFHEDFLKGTELAHQIKKYGFFSYFANEALHLSPKEEKQIELSIKRRLKACNKEIRERERERERENVIKWNNKTPRNKKKVENSIKSDLY